MRTIMFNSLLTRDPEQRRQAIRLISRVTKRLARIAYPPDTPNTLASHRSSVSSIQDGASGIGWDAMARAAAGISNLNLNHSAEMPPSPEELTSASTDDETRLRVRTHSRQDSWTVPVSPSVDENHLLRRLAVLPTDDATGDADDDVPYGPSELEEARELYKHIVLTVLRLSIDCPFEDVRTSFTELLAKLEASDKARWAGRG
jgi:hypothetical protein